MMNASVLTACLLLVPGLAQAAAPADSTSAAQAAMDAARAAYREAVPFREILEMTVEFPDGRKGPRKLDYGMGKGGEAFLTLSTNGEEVFRMIARDGRLVATLRNAAGTYAETPSQGDFAAALDRLGGAQANMAAPPGIVAAQGGDLGAFLAAFRLGILEPVEIAGFRPAGGSQALAEVDLRAANGMATVGLDAVSHRPQEIRLVLGEGKQQVRASGRFHFTAGDPGEALAWPDLTGRKAVGSLAEMEGRAYPLGQPAPDVTLELLGGGPVRIADLRGSVVVLDFWATWCVPCWKVLGHTAELAAWAKSSGLPVRVFALDTLETTEDPAEQRRQATEFLRSKKLDLPVLLDLDKKAFSAFHTPGLPSLVIIGRDGRLALHHSGVLPDMAETVRGEIEELLK
jgi:thiol-disulfide isomerase/thioredoxin